MEHIEQIITATTAKAFVRKARGKTLFVSVGQSAPIQGQPGYHFPVSGNIEVSRKAALKFIADAYSPTEAKGALCVIHEYGTCIFIGRAA